MGNTISENITSIDGGSFFQIIMVGGSLIGLSFLSVWGFQNNSLQAIALSVVFAIMFLISFIFSGGLLLKAGSWGANTTSFTLFYTMWLFLGKTPNSVLSLTENQLFSSVASSLPRFFEHAMTVYVIPIAEESMWLYGIPGILFVGMDFLGERISVFKNVIVQMSIVSLVGGVTFALFHVGRVGQVLFFVSAILFRVIITGLSYMDMQYDIIPKVSVVVAAGYGAHIGNNTGATGGFLNAMGLLFQNPQVGIFIFVILVVFWLSAINWLVVRFTNYTGIR